MKKTRDCHIEPKFDILIKTKLPWKMAQTICEDLATKLPYSIIVLVSDGD